MILFILSQIFGLFLFMGFNFGLFFYMRYKKSQLNKIPQQPIIEWRFRMLYFFLVLFCVVGLTHRIYTFYYEWDYQNNFSSRESSQISSPYIETL